MVSPMELLEKIAPTPTQSGGDESRAATLALRLIVALEGIAACSLYRSWPGGSMPRAAVVRLRNGSVQWGKAAPVVRQIARPLDIGRLGPLTWKRW